MSSSAIERYINPLLQWLTSRQWLPNRARLML